MSECYPETNPGDCNVCEGYTTTTNYPGVTWTGMLLRSNHDVNKCARGCLPCKQEELGTIKSAACVHGTRWMRAHEPVLDEDGNVLVPLKPNRCADGWVRDLRSMNPARDDSRSRQVLRIPRGISFLRGVCWRNPKAGEEHESGGDGEGFGTDPEPGRGPANPSSNREWDACNCDVEPSTGHPCGDDPGVGLHNPVPGTFRDDFFFPFTHYAKPFHCRKLLDRKSQVVDSHHSRLMPPVIWSAEHCGVNFFSHCAGKGKNDEQHCNEYGEGEGGPWLDGEGRQMWNQVYLDLSHVRLGYDKGDGAPGPNLLFQDEATRDFNNAIIQSLNELPNLNDEGAVIPGHPFDQMDYLGVRTNGQDIEHWERVYDPLSKPNFESFTPAIPLSKCRLRKTGAPVTVVPFVVKAKVKMNFQLIREDHTPLGSPTREHLQQFYPHCRFHLVIQMGYRAIPAWPENEPPTLPLPSAMLPKDHPRYVDASTPLEILNFDDPEYPHYLYEDTSVYPRKGHNMPPVVRRVGDTEDGLRDRQPDRILYIDDDDRLIDPPSRIDWWGFIGVHNTRPFPGDHIAIVPPERISCSSINYRMSNIVVGGWPMLHQTTAWEREHQPGLEDDDGWDNAQMYGGFLRLNFSASGEPDT